MPPAPKPCSRRRNPPPAASKPGLLADSSYNIKASDDPAKLGLLARQSRFTVAEGKVLSVGESGGTIYINFGRVWSRNLTVTILRRNKPAFEAPGMDPKKLEGTAFECAAGSKNASGHGSKAVRPEQIEVAAQE